jgi:branched-chain amino acid aminotransferase
MDIFYNNGEFVDSEKTVISVNDLIVLRGYGVFDFMRTYNRRPFYLKEHIERLENSARLINLELSWSSDEIYNAVMETVEKNPHHKECNIRIVCTGGISPDGVIPQGNGKLIIMVTAKHELPAWWYSDGASIITVNTERFLPGAKSTNYLGAVMAQQEAKRRGAIEAIYIDRNNNIKEGTTTNIFFFKGNRMITGKRDILSGVTRGVVLKLTENEFETELRDVPLGEVEDFDEAFITASNKEIVPVVKINDMVIGSGKPGKNTKKIMDMFRKYTEDYGRGLI